MDGPGPSRTCPHCGGENPSSRIVTLCESCGQSLESAARPATRPPSPPPFEPGAASASLPDDVGVPEPGDAEAPVLAHREPRPPRARRGRYRWLRLAAPVGILAWFTHSWWAPRLGVTRLWQELLVGRQSAGPVSGPVTSHVPPTPSMIEFTGHKGIVWGVAFSPDGRTVATAGEDRLVGLWPIDDGAGSRFLKGHTGLVRSVAFSPDGRWLASASFDRTIRIWEAAPGEQLQLLQDVRPTFFPVWLPDGLHLASGTEETAARIWNVRTGGIARQLSGHTDRVWAVALAPDGRTLATGSRDGTARLWDAQTGQAGPVLRGHKGVVSHVAFAPDGTRLATAGYTDQTVRFWDVRTGKRTGSWVRCGAPVYEIAFSPGGGWLAIACENGTVLLWDPRAGRLLTTLQGGGFCVAFAPGGAWLASGGREGRTTLWSRQHLMGLCKAGA